MADEKETSMGTAPKEVSVTQAVVDGDIIIRLNGGTTNIGPIPKGVGLERLRFDGEKVVDLMTLSEMWVQNKGGVFILHVIPLIGCQLVKMTYADRRRLINDGGAFRLLTEQEIHSAELKEKERAKNEALLKWLLSLDGEVILDFIRLFYLVVLAMKEPDSQIALWMNTKINDMKKTFKFDATERLRLERTIDTLRKKMGDYYA